MKEIEVRTEAIASQMCKERGLPMGMMELLLGDAYNLVYFGDKKELARIEAIVAKKSLVRRKASIK